MMTSAEKKKLQARLDRMTKLIEERKELGDELKELVELTAEESGKTKAVIKQLAKEWGMSQLEREGQRLHEEEMDRLRISLGMLGPLGEAAMSNLEGMTVAGAG